MSAYSCSVGTTPTSQTTYYISTFYKFLKVANLDQVKADLYSKAKELNVRGILILGEEGFNTTCSARSEKSLNEWKDWVQDYFNCRGLFFKDSYSHVSPFRRFVVKVRDEIVTTGIPEMMPPEGKNYHLSPEEWNRVLKEDRDFVLIDTRNWYEYNVGTFNGAINPNIEKFTEFPKFMEEQGISKEKKMLIFCTGGIRCEKGILELQKQGYKNVYQLEGGIINYIKEYPNQEFKGECFVFDHRVALDQELKPSTKYKLCPHCGQPAEVKISCARCDTETLICTDCEKKEIIQKTCSKNCAHHFKLHPERKGPRQLLPFEIEKMVEQGLSPEKAPTLRITKKKTLSFISP